MKILETSKFIAPIKLEPGDTLRVNWQDKNNKLCFTKLYKITKKQTVDTSVRVKFTKEELKSIKLKDAYGLIFGESDENT